MPTADIEAVVAALVGARPRAKVGVVVVARRHAVVVVAGGWEAARQELAVGGVVASQVLRERAGVVDQVTQQQRHVRSLPLDNRGGSRHGGDGGGQGTALRDVAYGEDGGGLERRRFSCITRSTAKTTEHGEAGCADCEQSDYTHIF